MRAAAIAAVAVAIAAVAVIVLPGGGSYRVKAIFQNASQIVGGDLVEVAGSPIGTVSDIALTPSGQALLTLDITDKAYAPLRQGTEATVRSTSLTGIANRYVDLRLGPGTGAPIHDGETIGAHATTSEVDLDQLLNTLDGRTRKALQNVIQGSATQYAGQGQRAQVAWQYLNPAIASTSRLFAELNRDTAKFTSFIVKSGNLVSDIAQRRADLSGLVQHLSSTTGALAAQHLSLGASIQQLPGFMRRADTTFVNLRAALDDLRPLVDAAKPVAPKLQKLLEQLRPLAQDAVPTVRDLSGVVSRPGPGNDLTELVGLGVPLAAATVRTVRAGGKQRPGAFPQTSVALNRSTPELATARPYAVDLTGWFEGYSHPATIDANGGASRIAPVVGVASLQNGALNFLPALVNPALRVLGAFGNGKPGGGLLTFGQGDRCPGSIERGAIYYPESGFPCNPRQVPTGR
jgi:phospholipid/cholesterol/gamma-HCH transport system substrate-binding protein